MKQAIVTVALAVPFVAVLTYAFVSAAAMPDVHFSYASGECVKVVNYTDTIYACESLPAKYNHVWVQ